MPRDIAEPDWKLLRKLKPLALERLCQRILDEIGVALTDSKSPHERYLAVYSLVQKRDKDVAIAFNDLRRSTALLCLGAMRSLDLISDEEFAGFSAATRDTINLLIG